jgi:hypothetical protein
MRIHSIYTPRKVYVALLPPKGIAVESIFTQPLSYPNQDSSRAKRHGLKDGDQVEESGLSGEFTEGTPHRHGGSLF